MRGDHQRFGDGLLAMIHDGESDDAAAAASLVAELILKQLSVITLDRFTKDRED